MTYCVKCNATPCACTTRSSFYDKVRDMTATEKQAEIVTRLDRLSDLRGKRAVARSNLRKKVALVADASKRFEAIRQTTKTDLSPDYLDESPWPSSEELRADAVVVTNLRNEADQLISELRDLGIDGDLLTINGK